MLSKAKLLLYYASFDIQLLSSVLLRVCALLHKSISADLAEMPKCTEPGRRNPRLRIAAAGFGFPQPLLTSAFAGASS